MKSKIKYIVFLCLLSVTLSLNVNAITLKETTTSGDEFDTIEANTTIIGVTKFTPQEVITAAKATKAGADDAKLYLKQNNNDDEDYESPTIYIYYGEIGGWYSLDENNEATYIEDEELINKLSNLNIYYVNNDLKTFTLDADYEVDTTKLPKGVTYEENKLNASVLINNFTIYNSNGDEIEYELTDKGTSLSAKYADDQCFNFLKDSWDVIATNVSENPSYYPLGCTKNVDMGEEFGIHKIRVANNTTPEVCSTKGFSQTACGFVLEFTDILTEYRMVSELAPSATLWQYNQMRPYVNGSIYDALPTKLKNVIIDTTVISGYDANDTNKDKYITTDKLYLLSSVEVWGTPFHDSITKENPALTKQLDFYKDLGVTNIWDSFVVATKKLGNNAQSWWLRNLYIADGFTKCYGKVADDGGPDIGFIMDTLGVSPAFRIG